MLFGSVSNRTAARMSAAIRPMVRTLIEPLEERRLLSAASVIDRTVGLALQSSGKPVALDVDHNGQAVIVRYLPNSTTLDTSFGTGGAVFTGVAANQDMAIAPGDKIVIAGGGTVARYNADGTVDATFGSNGSVDVGALTVDAVAVQGDGKVVLAAGYAGGSTAVVERLNANGTVDTTFASNGVYTFTPPQNSAYFLHDVLAESGGKIAVVGQTSPLGSGVSTPFIAQLTSTGAADPTVLAPTGLTGGYEAVTEGPDGGLIAAGFETQASDPTQSGLVVRYLPGGQTTFVVTNPGAGNADLPFFDSVALTPDGHVVAGGDAFTGQSGLHDQSNLVVARYDLSGNFDPSFAPNGTKVIDTGYADSGGYVAVASDNSIYVGDSAQRPFDHGVGPENQTYLFHLNANGSTAQSFGIPSTFRLPNVINAQDYRVGGEGVGYHDTDAANLGGLYRTSEGVDLESGGPSTGLDVGYTHAGEWLTYDVTVPTAGTFNFSAHVANYGSGGSFHVEIDGQNVTGTLAIPDTGTFRNYTDVVANGIAITAGSHVVRIVFEGQSQYGYSGNLQYFSFSQPTGGSAYGGVPPSVPATIQLENYDTGGEGVAYHDTDAVNSGGQYRPNEGVDLESTGDADGGYDVAWTHTGEYLKYSVSVAADGKYNFNTRVANYGSGATFHWEVDGVNVTGELAVPDTGNFQTWTTVTAPATTLTQGTHVLRLVIDSQSQYGYGGNFNYLQIAGGQDGLPFGGTPTAIPATLQAENYNTGGEGVAYHDTTAGNEGGAYRTAEGVDLEALPNGGSAVDYTHAGEWMKYTVSMAAPGTYQIAAHVANYGSGGAFHIEIDGINVTGTRAVPDTGSFTNFVDVTQTGLYIPAGQHVVRFVWDGESQYGFAGNLDYFRVF